MVSMLRSQAHARAVVQPQPAPRLLLLRNLQPFTAPDPLHPILAHIPAGLAQKDRNAAVSISTILVSQRNDGPGQRVFIVPLCRVVAMRAAWLMDQLARMALTHTALLCSFHSGTPPLRA